MSIETVTVSEVEAAKILSSSGGHFLDVKAIEVLPDKLSRTLAAFANAEGGELYIGIDESKTTGIKTWRGFANPEGANGFIQCFIELFPLGEDNSYTFLRAANKNGLILKVEIKKSRDLQHAADGKVYLRRGAQSIPIVGEDGLARLLRNKGLVSFETEPIAVPSDLITNSEQVITFMLEIIPTAEPEHWLKKQQVLKGEKPTVAGLVLFADEPQAALPKRCGIKIYRYKTKDDVGTRETLAFDPISVDGSAYIQIKESVRQTVEFIESVRINTPAGLEKVSYPIDALHEIITNAVIHRDYSIADDIHIRIFDNRIEVKSPGTLPAHITPDNILQERFARNGVIVRLINKFPDPPNKDVGEGLDTAFEAMRDMKLKPPVVVQQGNYVIVVLRHEPLASPEEVILEYLQKHEQIRNREARDVCYIGSENKIKVIFQRMMKQGLIELVPGATRYTASYRLVKISQEN